MFGSDRCVTFCNKATCSLRSYGRCDFFGIFHIDNILSEIYKKKFCKLKLIIT